MVDAKNGPRGTGARGKLYGVRQLNPTKPAQPEVVHLHIKPDGTELRFNEQPRDLLTLRVEVLADCEQTKTANIWIDGKTSVTSVKPRGRGWRLYATPDDEPSSIWRRPRLKAGAP